MPLFCTICNNLLSGVSRADNFYFECVSCKEIYKPTAVDTLRHEQIKGTDLVTFKTILQNANRDPVNPKVKKKCTKCDSKYVKQVRLGDDMRLINCCIKCNERWIEGL